MLRRKQRLLLKVLELSGGISRLRLVKLMFLLSKDEYISLHHPVYDFVPYKYGPFSFELYNDLGSLRRQGMVLEEGETEVCLRPLSERSDPRVATYVETSLERLARMDERTLIGSIYDTYPDYTIFSEIDRRRNYERDETGLVSLGYQGISIDGFIGKLIEHKVQTVIDLRRNPSSMKYSFSKKRLRENLSRFGIGYYPMPELGIASEERRNLKTLEDYRALFSRYRNVLGEDNPLVDELIAMGQQGKVAMICYESDPDYCHRGVVSDMIRRRGYEVVDA
jgi:uncharacterized protein (DUF488 family)